MAARKPATKGPHYRALRVLTIGKKKYEPGQEVPEAQDWPRVDAWVRARMIELVEA